MSTNGYPPKTTNMAPTGGLFGSQQRPDDNVGASDDNAGNTPRIGIQFRQPTNQFHSPPQYSYSPSQIPFPGASQFYRLAPFNLTPSSQASSAATQWYQSYGPSWQASDFPQGGYGGPQMFPPQQFTGYGPSSPGAPRVPPAPPQNNPVIWPTSLTSTALEHHPNAPGRASISLPTNWFQRAAEQRSTDVAGIAEMPPIPQISYDEYNAQYESDNLSDLGGAEGQAPINPKQTEFSLKQYVTGWCSPTLVPSTSGRKDGWLSFWRRSISPWSGDRTVWHSCEMDPCIEWWWLQIFQRISRTGWHWNICIIPNGFGDSGLRCVRIDVQVRFGRRGRREGEAEGNARQQATSNRFERMHGQKCKSLPPRVAKYNIHGCDSSGAEWQRWPDLQHPTWRFVHRCDALERADWFHQKKLWPEETILSDRDIPMQLDAGDIGRRVYGIIRTGANYEWPSICSDIIQQFPFQCLQVETGIQCETIFGGNEGSYREGYCRALN